MNYFQQNGYAIAHEILDSAEIKFIKSEIANVINNNLIYGIRHLDKKVSAINNLANSTKIINLLTDYFDKTPQLIGGIYSNKTINDNWFVNWHQDKTIAVKHKIETSGFKNWTTKQGVIHVQPPLSIMQQIITLRIHLDKTNIRNGALQLIPNSHQQGILTPTQITQIKKECTSMICEVNAGDALIMSPLTLHRSGKSQSKRDRTIIHLEYSVAALPNNLAWL